MQVRIFEAPDMTTGLKRIREELGPDALILSTRTRRDGPLGLLGKPLIEITAAIDGQPNGHSNSQPSGPAPVGQAVTMTERGLLTGGPVASAPAKTPASDRRIDLTVGGDDDLLTALAVNEEPLAEPPPKTLKKRGGKKTEASTVNPAADGAVAKTVAKGAAARLEISPEPAAAGKSKTARQPRSRKTTADAAMAPAPSPEPPTEPPMKLRAKRSVAPPPESSAPLAAVPPHILSYLKEKCGIEAETAAALARYASQRLSQAHWNDRQAVRACLVDAVQNFISVAPPDFTDGGQKRIALVGPTGVGKTTTIAKLAAWYMAHHHGKLALITIDTYRIAAVEQLKVYGEIMRLPVEVVIDPEQLAVCLGKHRDAGLILIDTSGHSPHNAEAVAELGEFFTGVPAIEKHLALSATTREAELLHSLRAFEPLAAERTIFTKIDECSNLGVLLNVQLHNAQPLSFLTNGQRVPEDLLVIDRRSVAELILSEGAFHA